MEIENIDAEPVTPTQGSGCGGCLGGIFFLFMIVFGICSGIKSCTKNMLGNHGGYITTLQEFNEYTKIDDVPMGKEIGKINQDVVLKVLRVTKKGNLTWVFVYKLSEDDVPVKTYIIIPEKINIKKENEFVSFNEESVYWNDYYSRIDEKNAPLYEKYKMEFRKSISNIEVSYGEDNIIKESIKNTAWILDSKGYFDLYVAGENDFYYIDKDYKDDFLKAYEKNFKKYEKEKIKYF